MTTEAETPEQMAGEIAAETTDTPEKEVERDPFDIPSPEEEMAAMEASDQEAGVDGPAGDAEDDDEAEVLPIDLRERAEQMGLTDDDLSAYESPDVLRRHLEILASKSPKEEAEPTPAFEMPERPDFTLELDPDSFDPEITEKFNGVMGKVADYYEGVITSVAGGLQKDLDAVLGFMEAKQQEAESARVEQFIAGLGEDWKDVFGGGADRKPKHFRNIRKFSEERKAIAAGYEATGRKLPSESELDQKAVRAAFSDRSDTIARQKVRKATRDRSGKFSRRPTSRQGTPQTGRGAAIAAVRGILKASGATDGDEGF